MHTAVEPAKRYVENITNRKKNTHMGFIPRIVNEGSFMHTDEWKGYEDVSVGNYTHRKITHKYHFIDTAAGVHTQHVESYHNKLK